MPISSLNVTTNQGQQWNAQNTITGLSSTTGNAGANSKSQTYSNATANNALGGADEYFNYLITISASGTANIDLTSLIDILQTSGIALARLKAFQFQLLSLTDDPVNGTICTEITIGNAASNAQPLNIGATGTYQVFTGGSWSYFDQTAGGFVVDSTHKIIKIVNNDSSHVAAVRLQLTGGTS